MATSTAEHGDRRVELESGTHGVGFRIDAPHQLGDGVPEADVPAEAGAPLVTESADVLEQLRQQSRQLAAHLLARQRDTDIRESRINARQSMLENEVRSERLWLLERRAELAEQADDLVRRECELQERASRVSAAEEHLALANRQAEQSSQQQSEQLRQRSDHLAADEQRLAGQWAAFNTAQRRWQSQRRRQQQALRRERQTFQSQTVAAETLHRGLLAGIERQHARLASIADAAAQREAAWRAEVEQQEAAHEERLAQFAERRQLLELSEAALEQEWEDVRRQQAQIAMHSRKHEEELEAQREHVETERQEWQARLHDEQLCLARRRDEIDSRRLELEQLQENLRQLHKETLETRLASEELLGQLSGAIPPATLTSSISRLRRKLDDHFRLAQSDLSHQRHALEELRAELAERHEQLLKQRVEVQDWARQREATLEQQAALLVAREQELDSQQNQFKSLEQRWQVERQSYRQEIRQLLARIRQEDVPA